jgi:hypothetical protein
MEIFIIDPVGGVGYKWRESGVEKAVGKKR